MNVSERIVIVPLDGQSVNRDVVARDVLDMAREMRMWREKYDGDLNRVGPA